MKTQILEILNRGGVHIPTVEEWMEIAEIIMNDDRSTEAWAIELMQRFEEMVRGKLVEKPNSETGNNVIEWIDKVWQAALLTKEMFVCEVEKPKEEDYHNFNRGGVLAYNKALKAYKSAQEKVWFDGADEEVIDAYLGKTVFCFIYDMSDSVDCNVRFTENFVKELLK